MSSSNDEFNDLWELAEFVVREAFLLRSLLENLRLMNDPPEVKTKKIQNWRKEIGMHLGNPLVSDLTAIHFQKVRALPPEQRRQSIQEALDKAHSEYFV
jgi:hypothetical protein